jgi:hypothetical protein
MFYKCRNIFAYLQSKSNIKQIKQIWEEFYFQAPYRQQDCLQLY